MSLDDTDRLGPKGHVYVELVREQWRAPLERGSARRALLTAVLGVVLMVLGVIGLFTTYGESLFLVAIGLLAFVSSFREISALRPEFEEARRIGWVEPSLDDSHVSVGEPATFRAVLHARRKLVLRSARVRAEARPWEGAVEGAVTESLVLPVANATAQIASGDEWRTAVTFRIPPAAPPSSYSSTESLRWTMTLELTFDDQAPWMRTWPMLVYPAENS